MSESFRARSREPGGGEGNTEGNDAREETEAARRLLQLILGRHDELDDRRSFLLGMAVGRLQELYRYLALISTDYERANAAFLDRVRELQAVTAEWAPGTQPPPPEVARRFDTRDLGTRLHLTIETFYLFAKILLDKAAQTIEFHFGPARSASLERHHKLNRNLPVYAKQLDLAVPDSLFEKAGELSVSISAYRDRQVAHEASPRSMKGTSFSLAEEEALVSVNRVYPVEGEIAISSQSPRKLMQEIEKYLIEVVDLIETNRLKIKP